MTNPPAADEPAAASAKAKSQEPDDVRIEPSFTADYLPDGEPTEPVSAPPAGAAPDPVSAPPAGSPDPDLAPAAPTLAETVLPEPATSELAASEPAVAERTLVEPAAFQASAYEPSGYEPPAWSPTPWEPAVAAADHRPETETELQPEADSVPPISAAPTAEIPAAGQVPPFGAEAPSDAPAPGATSPFEAGAPSDAPAPGAAPPPGSFPPPPGGFPPPPGGYPPPGGFSPGGFPPPGSGFSRSALIRPTQGRYVAGVCAAIGRATNTDPTLWRVIFAVLTLAGGISIVAYLLGWLLLPAEGDTGSPLEALLGRGKSSTSAPLAIVIGVGAVLAFLLVMSRNVGAAAVGLAVVIGVVALIVRGQGDRQPAPIGPFAPAPGPPPTPPFPPSAPPFPSGMAAAVPTTQPMQRGAMAPPVFVPPPPADPTATLPPVPPTFAPGYRPPFAPHGPFKSPYAASLGYPPPGGPGAPYPGLGGPPPKPPKPPKERSRLGRVVFFLICLALGVLAALEVTVADFKASTFFAVPLAIVALGLIFGAWIGRARLLILLGALLSIALAISTASTMEDGRPPRQVEDIAIDPTSAGELDTSYSTDVGDIQADLSQVDFSEQDLNLSLRVNYAGDISVTLPRNVDVIVDVHIQGGGCRVFDNDCSGFNQTTQYTNNGADGPGGGKLHLDLDVRYGDLEVTR